MSAKALITTSSVRRPLFLMLLAALLALCACSGGDPLPTVTPEPIVPTRTPRPDGATATPPPEGPSDAADEEEDDEEVAYLIPTLTAAEAAALHSVGVAGALEDVEPAAALGLRFGQFTFWRVNPELPDVPNLTTWQTIRFGQVVPEEQWPANRAVVEETLRAHPGSTWLIGNEPDVIWQDNLSAEEYAVAYHELYTFLKERDPTAVIGAGGIALPTPLRLAYLDEVLRVYEERFGRPLPAELWSVHLFILREERDSWGIDIPKGMTQTTGQLYEIEDHGNVDLVKAYVSVFRDWMAANGYGDLPLAVTEFGILLPEDYGFPPEFVQAYMAETYDYFLTATGANGLAADGGRLVQYAFWYNLYDGELYPTGNLYDSPSGKLTHLGEAFKRYIEGLK